MEEGEVRCRLLLFFSMAGIIYRISFTCFQLCVILEPMQELMSRHKAYALSPRDCLKTTLFQKWQRMVAPPGKRGRRTVALHEKHQPVEPNGRPVYRRIRFSIARRLGIFLVDLLPRSRASVPIGFYDQNNFYFPSLEAPSPYYLILYLFRAHNPLGNRISSQYLGIDSSSNI